MDRYKILLVDDDGLVLTTVRIELEKRGFDVQIAHDATEVLSLVAEETGYDLAIVDINMPGPSGLELASGLCEIGVGSLFLTAYDNKELVEQAVKCGAMGYLVKPIEPARMIPTIEAAIQRCKDINALTNEKKRLDHALETGHVVNVVVGILMERHSLARQEAFEILRKKARSERRKVKEVAEEVLGAWDFISGLTNKN